MAQISGLDRLAGLGPRGPADGLHLIEGTVIEQIIREVPVLRVDVAGTIQERERFSAAAGFQLHKGDRLLLLTEDWQSFYIMYKVVQL